MHSLKMYAEVPLPAIASWKQFELSSIAEINGEFELELVGGAAFVYPDPNNSTGHYPVGTDLVLLARAEIGYGFSRWEDITNPDNVVEIDTEARIVLPLNSDMKVRAVFSQDPSYIVVAKAFGEDGDGNTVEMGSFLYEPEPVAVFSGVDGAPDTLQFIAGVGGVTITSDPVFGFQRGEYAWVTEAGTPYGVDAAPGTINAAAGTISFSGVQMIKDNVMTLYPEFEYIYDRVTFTWVTEESLVTEDFDYKGNLEFRYEGEAVEVEIENIEFADGNAIFSALLPKSAYHMVELVPVGEPTYYAFRNWVRDSVFKQETVPSVVDPSVDSIITVFDSTTYTAPNNSNLIAMDDDKQVKIGWVSANTRLASFETSIGTLDPAFDPEVLNYTLIWPDDLTDPSVSVTTTAVSQHAEATIGLLGTFAFTPNQNRPLRAAVTSPYAEAGTRTYQITAIRPRITATSVVANSQSEVKLFPNPVVDGGLTIENENVTEGELIEVYNMSGALVATYTAAGSVTSISVSQLATGTYILKVGKLSARFVKQ